MFDKKWNRRYQFSRLVVFAIFIFIVFFVAYKILFPSASFVFSFRTPNSTKNSIINMKNGQGDFYENGHISAGKNPIFETSLAGDFSKTDIVFNLDENLSDKLKGVVEIRKSHQAFFYPTEGPLEFNNGSLLKNNTEYFMVSDGAIRKFSSMNAIDKLGFKKEAFIEVTSSDLTLNPRGNNITENSSYPADSIFHILDEYFQLKNDVLLRFVSEKAYLSQYSPSQAIEKDLAFLDNYSVAEEYLGFSDGTLLSADISVYVTSGKELYPINNPITFESDGYLWSDIIPANSEEIGIYEQQKLFTIDSPHPDGTIFHTQDSGKYYYIKNETKREITSAAVLKTYPRASYIPVMEKSLETSVSCSINPTFRLFGLYKCASGIQKINNFPGNSYQFATNIDSPIVLDSIDVEFSQLLDWNNTKKSLGSLKNKVFKNYGLN